MNPLDFGAQRRDGGSLFDGRHFLDQLRESDFDAVLVGEIMTTVSFSVEPETLLSELCEFLVRRRIHRALVVAEGQLLGIVTSVDVLRAVAEFSLHGRDSPYIRMIRYLTDPLRKNGDLLTALQQALIRLACAGCQSLAWRGSVV